MNVNSQAADKSKRIRRTPEEAKSLILKVASERLARLGLEGLNISGVAKDAGMSHGTVIHHFGSTGAMREALLHEMTRDLLSDVMAALDSNEAPEKILDRLFSMLSQDGHGKLLAWRALEPREDEKKDTSGDLFRSIIDSIAEESGSRSDAKQLVYLVAIAAVGQSVCGDVVSGLVGMSDEDSKRFPIWFANTVGDI